MSKWIKQVRALPSNPGSNDHLKTDYIDVNLNNSRALIGNLQHLADNTDELIKNMYDVNDSLFKLHAVQHELSWVKELEGKKGERET